MIMLGTTPRRLGRGSALVAFALSALLLPLTPSWAQKPDEAESQVEGAAPLPSKSTMTRREASQELEVRGRGRRRHRR